VEGEEQKNGKNEEEKGEREKRRMK